MQPLRPNIERRGYRGLEFGFSNLFVTAFRDADGKLGLAVWEADGSGGVEVQPFAGRHDRQGCGHCRARG